MEQKQEQKQMRIAIVSDMHGNWPVVAESIKQNIKAEGTIDYLMCLGDYAADGRQLEKHCRSPLMWCTATVMHFLPRRKNC